MIADDLKDRFPSVSVSMPDFGGTRTLFLVRSDGQFVLAWDIAGKPYKLKIMQLKQMKPIDWESFEENGYLSFRKGTTVYTVGPWTRTDRTWKLGSLSSASKQRKKVGEGKSALQYDRSIDFEF